MFTWLDYGKLGLASGLFSGATVSGCSKAGINDWKALSAIGLLSFVGSGGTMFYYLTKNTKKDDKLETKDDKLETIEENK